MPKLLSRSKHEEFESNSALEIKDQKERRAKSEEKHHCRKASSASTVHSSSTVHPAVPVPLLFDASTFCYNFWFFPILTLVIPYDFGCFCNFP